MLYRALSIVAAAALSTSCQEAEPEVPSGGTVVIAELNAPKTLLPIVEETVADAQLNGILFPGLTQLRWSEGGLRAGRGPLALAERWEMGTDSLSIIFQLRRGITWSDGAPITARDVAFSYELYGDTLVGSPRWPYVQEIASVEPVDDRTVIFTFRRRYPAMLIHASGGVVPEHVYRDADRRRLRAHPTVVQPADGKLVVSGPFQVGSWMAGERVVLAPNPRSWVQPRLDRVVVRVIPEEITRIAELETGGVDVAQITSFDLAHRLRARPDTRIERQPMRFYDYIGWSPGARPFFADPEIRRALSLAIDRQEILAGLGLKPYATAAGGPYPPIFPALQSTELAPDPHRPQEAAAILDRLGWRDRDGDGVRDRDGAAMRFTLLTNAGNARRVNAAQIIQSQLRALGIDVALRQMETATFFQKLRERDFEAALAGWAVALTPELNMFRSDVPGLNFVAYANPAVDSLLALARAQPTDERATPLWREAAGQIVRDRPYAFLWYYDMLWAVRDRVRNTRIDPLGAYQNVHEWYVSGSADTTAVAASRP